ncbi:uncharacterized protein LOC136025816 isoform X2 [Artemia franciscana]|uniref:uncharacterized protein LOC136025816 isoform X2 n=1 Tax=Artemia franciscana TaxID=6661 RepID=UPI0032DA5637
MTHKRPNLGPYVPGLVKTGVSHLVAFILILNLSCSYSAPVTNDVATLDYSEGCFYMMQHYEEGERIITNEPCLNCTCQNSMLMCFLKVCPFAKPIGQNCTVEKRPDQCCPVITCPEVPVPLMIGVVSTTTRPVTPSSFTGLATLSDEEGCVIDDKYYPDGAQVPSDPSKPCDLCYCIRNHTACVMQECILYVDGCAPVFEEGVCCPVRYECDRDKIPQVIGTTQPPAIANSGMCFRNGEAFVDGALVPTDDPCEHCYCMHGDIVCAVQECGKPMQPLGDNCVAIAPKEGQCCPEAYECYTTSTEVDIVPSDGQQQENGDFEGSDSQNTERPAEDKIEESSEDTSSGDSVLEVVPPTSEQQLSETSDNKTPESLEELLTTESEAVTSQEATRPPVFEATVVETEEDLSSTSAPPVESLSQETNSEEDVETETTFPSSESQLAGEEDQLVTVLPETSESQPETIPDDAVVFPGPPSQESEVPEDIASSLDSQKPLQEENSMTVNLDELVGKDDITSEDQGSHQVITSSLGESTPETAENGPTAEKEEETTLAQLAEESAQAGSNLSEGEDQSNFTDGLETESSIPEDISDLGDKNEVQSSLETDLSVAEKEESTTEAQDLGSGAFLVEQTGETDTGSGEGSLMQGLVSSSAEFSGEESVTESSLNLDYNVENEQSNEKDDDLLPIQSTEDHNATGINENPATDLMIESGSGSLSSEHELGVTETSDSLSDKTDTISETNNQLLEHSTETLNSMEINPTPVQIMDSGSDVDQIKEASGEVFDSTGNSETITEDNILETEGSGNISTEEITTGKEPELNEGSGEQLEVEDLDSVDKTEEIQSQTEITTIDSTEQNALTVSGDGEEISINNEGSGEQLEAEDSDTVNKNENDIAQSQTESPATQFVEDNSSTEIEDGSGSVGETSTDEVGSGEQLEAENLDSIDTNDETENQPEMTTSQFIEQNSLTDMDEGSGNVEEFSSNEEGSSEQTGAENPDSGEKIDENQSQTEAPIEQSTEENNSLDIDEGSGTLEEISTSDNAIKEQDINEQGSGVFLEMLDLTSEKEPESQSGSGDNVSQFGAEGTSRPNILLEEGSGLVMVESSGNDGQIGDESLVPSIVQEIEDEFSGNNELNSKEDTNEANSIAPEVTTVNSIENDVVGNTEGAGINLDFMLTVTETSESETTTHLTEKEVMETEKENDFGSVNAEQVGNVESETSEKLDNLDESTDDPVLIGDNNIPGMTEFPTSMIDLGQEINESNNDLGSGENLEKEDNENNEDLVNLLEATFEPEILVASAKPEMVLINTNKPENLLEAQSTVAPIQEGAEDIESSGEGLVNESSNGLGSGEKLDNEEKENIEAVTEVLEIGTESEVLVTSAKPEMVQINTNDPGNLLGSQGSIAPIQEGAEEVESSGEELSNEDTDGLGSGENLEKEENENNLAMTDVLEIVTEQQIIVTSAKPEVVQINTNQPGSLLGTESPIIPIQEGAEDPESSGEPLIDEKVDDQIDKEDSAPFSTTSEGTEENNFESSGFLLTEDPTQNPEIPQGSETDSSTEKSEWPVGSIEQSGHSEIDSDLEGLEEMEFSGHSTLTPDNSHSIDSEGSGDNSLPQTQESQIIEGSGSFETELNAGNTEIESPESEDGDALLSNGEEEENQDSSQTEAESTDNSGIEEATLTPMNQLVSSQTSEPSSSIEEGGPKDESEYEVVDNSIETATEKADMDQSQTTESAQEGSMDQPGNEEKGTIMEVTTENGETIEQESTESILEGSENENGNATVDDETQSATEKEESFGQESTENGQEVTVDEAVDTVNQAATEKDEIIGQDPTESLPSNTNDQLSASGPEESNNKDEELNLESLTDNINVASEITEVPENAEFFNTEKSNVMEDDENTVSLGLEITTELSQLNSEEGSGMLPINPDEESITNEIDSSEISTDVPLGTIPDISVDENMGSGSQILEEEIQILEPTATDSPSDEVKNETTLSAEDVENTSEVSGSSESLEELLSTDKRPDAQSEEATKPPIFEATVVETESDMLSTSTPLFETTSNGEMLTGISLTEETDDKVDTAVEETDTTDKDLIGENVESSTHLTADNFEPSLHEMTTRRIDENANSIVNIPDEENLINTGDVAPVPSNTDRPDDSDVAEATAMSVDESFVDNTEETLAELSLNEDKDRSEITENLSNISATESSNLITESETSPQDGFSLDYDADSTEITPITSTDSDLEDNSDLTEVTTKSSDTLPESTSPSFIGEALTETGATGSPQEESLDNSTESDGSNSVDTEKPAEDKVEEPSENTSTSDTVPEDVSPTGEQQISETSDNKTPESLEELLTTDNEDVAPHEEATKPPVFEATVVEAEVDMSSTSVPLVETLPQEVPGEGNCFVEGITYPNGGFVRSSSSCMINCVCKDSIVTCSVPNCPSPPESLNCSPVERSGDCCPQYACPGSCFVEGEVYENFSPVPTNDSCRSCFCINSQLECITPVCSRPPELGCRLVKVNVPGECCPSWKCLHGESGSVFPPSESQLAGEEEQSATVLPETSELQQESIPDDAVIFPGPPSQESEVPEDIASSLNSQKPLQGGNSMVVNLDEIVGKDDVTSEGQGSHQVIASNLGDSTVAPQTTAEDNNNKPVSLEEKIDEEVMDEETNQSNGSGIQEVAEGDTGSNENVESEKDSNGSDKGEDMKAVDDQDTIESLEPIKEVNVENLAIDSDLESVPNPENETPENSEVEDNIVDNKETTIGSVNMPEEQSENEEKPGEESNVEPEGESISDVEAQQVEETESNNKPSQGEEGKDDEDFETEAENETETENSFPDSGTPGQSESQENTQKNENDQGNNEIQSTDNLVSGQDSQLPESQENAGQQTEQIEGESEVSDNSAEEGDSPQAPEVGLDNTSEKNKEEIGAETEGQQAENENDTNKLDPDSEDFDTLPQEEIAQKPAEENFVQDTEQGPNKETEVGENAEDKDEEASSDLQSPNAEGPSVSGEDPQTIVEPVPETDDTEIQPIEELDSSDLTPAVGTAEVSLLEELDSDSQEPEEIDEDSEFDEEESPDLVIGPGACLFDGKVFVSAQQIPRDDPCDFCFCFRGDIICLQQSCPPPIPGCFEEAIGGFCCPRYECPVRQAFQNITVQPTIPPLPVLMRNPQPIALPLTQVQIQGCEILGEFFQQGEIIPRASGPCLECKCGMNGMMECDPRACQPEPMLRKMMTAAVKRRRRSLGKRLGREIHFHISGDRLIME